MSLTFQTLFTNKNPRSSHITLSETHFLKSSNFACLIPNSKIHFPKFENFLIHNHLLYVGKVKASFQEPFETARKQDNSNGSISEGVCRVASKQDFGMAVCGFGKWSSGRSRDKAAATEEDLWGLDYRGLLLLGLNCWRWWRKWMGISEALRQLFEFCRGSWRSSEFDFGSTESLSRSPLLRIEQKPRMLL